MAAVADVAIRRALREVLEGTATGVRAITPGLLSCDVAQGTADLTLSLRTASAARVEIAIAYPMLEDRPQQPSNIWMRGIEVTLTYSYLLEVAVAAADRIRRREGRCGVVYGPCRAGACVARQADHDGR